MANVVGAGEGSKKLLVYERCTIDEVSGISLRIYQCFKEDGDIRCAVGQADKRTPIHHICVLRCGKRQHVSEDGGLGRKIVARDAEKGVLRLDYEATILPHALGLVRQRIES